MADNRPPYNGSHTNNACKPLARGAMMAIGIWGLAIIGGFGFLAAYAGKPGDPTATAGYWPTNSGLPRNQAGLTVLVFVHPHCPCSSATRAELERILARVNDASIAILAVFVKPPGTGQGWEQTALWRDFDRLPGVTSICDDPGIEAGKFGASTSGHVFVYGHQGDLLFDGGITGARGHEGDNLGSIAVQTLLARGKFKTRRTPVFGCPLLGENPAKEKGGPSTCCPL